MIDITGLRGQTTFVTGSSRGAGKTSLLNYLAAGLRAYGPVGLASIGADEKKSASQRQGDGMGSRVAVETSDLVITTGEALASSAGLYRIVDEMGRRSSLGRIVCAHVLRGCQLDMIGPETNKQLADLLERCRVRHGMRTFLIDGAFHRITQVATLSGCGFIEVIKIDGSALGAASRRLKFLAYMDHCPVWSEDAGATTVRAHHVDGALTKERLADIPAGSEAIVVEDLTKIFLDVPSLVKLPLMVKRKITLRAIVLNPWGVDCARLGELMAASALQDRIMLSPFWQDTGTACCS